MEYFIVANSCAAPFFSDSSEKYVKANSAEAAMTAFRKAYNHPCGLFSAAVYENADAFHKGHPAMFKWLSEKAKKAA